MTRKKLFEVALVYAGWTKSGFAGVHKIAGSTLHDVLEGERVSSRISAVIDEFCEEWIGKLKKDLKEEK